MKYNIHASRGQTEEGEDLPQESRITDFSLESRILETAGKRLEAWYFNFRDGASSNEQKGANNGNKTTTRIAKKARVKIKQAEDKKALLYTSRFDI
jgi:hypothetical protein